MPIRPFTKPRDTPMFQYPIQPIACEDLRFLAFSDASFSSKKNPDSQTGCVIMSTHKEIGNNTTCLVNPISWGCKKIQRVVTSTLAAETVSLSSVLDQLSWIRLCWAWVMDSNVRWQNPEAALRSLPQSFSTATMKAQRLTEDTVATDCKSLFDLVTRTAPPACSEFRTQLNARKIKDLLAEGIQLRWVHSGAQLADSLTKIMDTSFLRETLLQGKYRLNDELEILKARSDARTRLKWLRSNCHENSSLEPSPWQNFWSFASVNFIPWQGDSSCFPCIRYPARSIRHETAGGNHFTFWSNRGSGPS